MARFAEVAHVGLVAKWRRRVLDVKLCAKKAKTTPRCHWASKMGSRGPRNLAGGERAHQAIASSTRFLRAAPCLAVAQSQGPHLAARLHPSSVLDSRGSVAGGHGVWVLLIRDVPVSRSPLEAAPSQRSLLPEARGATTHTSPSMPPCRIMCCLIICLCLLESCVH